jgi:hypothetical protein
MQEEGKREREERRKKEKEQRDKERQTSRKRGKSKIARRNKTKTNDTKLFSHITPPECNFFIDLFAQLLEKT